MRLRLLSLCVAGVALVYLTACNTPAESNLPQQISNCDQSSSGTALASGQEVQAAPSFEEIRPYFNRILAASKATPLSRSELNSIRDYLDSLSGKRVTGWCGWVSSVLPTEDMLGIYKSQSGHDYEGDFRMYVVMDDPSLPVDEHGPNSVRVTGLTRSQAQIFSAWHGAGVAGPKYEKVLFTGQISGVIALEEIHMVVDTVHLVQ